MDSCSAAPVRWNGWSRQPRRPAPTRLRPSKPAAEPSPTTGDAADGLYNEAMDRLSRTRFRPELARAQLLYGQWLRHAGRRSLARDQLHSAYTSFDTMGDGEAFAERARRELQATGEKVRRHTVESAAALTAQEQQVAELARDGLSNPEIGLRLFISPRTVEWHLHKVFDKLGITSRKDLRDALPRPEVRPVT